MNTNKNIVEIAQLNSILDAVSAAQVGNEVEASKMMHAAGFSINPLPAIMGALNFVRMGALRLLGFKAISKASLGELFAASLSIAVEVLKRTGTVGKVVAVVVGGVVTYVSAKKALSALKLRRWRRALEGGDFWVRPHAKGSAPFRGMVINYKRHEDRVGTPVIDFLDFKTRENISLADVDVTLRHDAPSYKEADSLSPAFISESASRELTASAAGELKRARDACAKAHGAGVQVHVPLDLYEEEEVAA